MVLVWVLCCRNFDVGFFWVVGVLMCTFVHGMGWFGGSLVGGCGDGFFEVSLGDWEKFVGWKR